MSDGEENTILHVTSIWEPFQNAEHTESENILICLIIPGFDHDDWIRVSSDHLSQHSQVSHQNLKILETAMLAILTGFIILYNLQRINSQSRSADLYLYLHCL